MLRPETVSALQGTGETGGEGDTAMRSTQYPFVRLALAAIAMLLACPGPHRADAANNLASTWKRAASVIPPEFKASGKETSRSYYVEQAFHKSTPGAGGMPARLSTFRLMLAKGRALSAAGLASQRAQAKKLKLEPLDIGDYATISAPKPAAPKKTNPLFRRPSAPNHGKISIFVIDGPWRFKLSLSARKSHFDYAQAKALAMRTAKAVHAQLAEPKSPPDKNPAPPASSKQALSFETRLVIGADERIPEDLDDAKAWQEYINAQIKARGHALPEGFDNVAQTFRHVGREFVLSGKRRMNWPALLVQSLHETGFYKYGRRAKARNFNVAGVGITESDGTTIHQDFGKLHIGVKAFFQHMSIYATGEKCTAAIAERTRNETAVIIGKYKQLKRNHPSRGPIALRDLGCMFAGDERTARKYSGLNDKKRKKDTGANWPAAAHIARLRQRITSAHKKYGGATLAYAGDPIYGGSVMDLWVRATAEVRRIHRENKAMSGRGR
jgi:hypothetical protein